MVDPDYCAVVNWEMTILQWTLIAMWLNAVLTVVLLWFQYGSIMDLDVVLLWLADYCAVVNWEMTILQWLTCFTVVLLWFKYGSIMDFNMVRLWEEQLPPYCNKQPMTHNSTTVSYNGCKSWPP